MISRKRSGLLAGVCVLATLAAGARAAAAQLSNGAVLSQNFDVP